MAIDQGMDARAALARSEAQRNAARQSYTEVLNKRGNELHALNEKSGPDSRAYRSVADELEHCRSQLERIATTVQRPLNRWHIRASLLVVTGVVLSLLEAPVNKFLFDVALQSSSFASYTISIAFAAFLLVLAHVSGRSLRQIWSDYRKRIVWSSLFIFLLTITVLATLVSILTVARAAFATDTGNIQDLLSGVQSSVGTLGIWGTLVAALSDISALVLATINIGGIFVTMMLAFFTHDPDMDFDHAANALAIERKKLDKIHKAHAEAMTAIINEHATALAGFGANFKTANAGVIENKGRLGIELNKQDHEMIADLDQMAEDAERARAGAMAVRPPSVGNTNEPSPDRPAPALRAIDGERKAAS